MDRKIQRKQSFPQNKAWVSLRKEPKAMSVKMLQAYRFLVPQSEKPIFDFRISSEKDAINERFKTLSKDFVERPKICPPRIPKDNYNFIQTPLPSLRTPFKGKELETEEQYYYCPYILQLPAKLPFPDWPLPITSKQQEIYADWVSRTRLYVNSLSVEETKAIEDYQYSTLQTHGYGIKTIQQAAFINSYLESKPDTQYDTNKIKVNRIYKLLQKVINGAPLPKDDLYIYRGTSCTWYNPNYKPDKVRNFTEFLFPPKKFTTTAFSSFSVDFDKAFDFAKMSYRNTGNAACIAAVKINKSSCPMLLMAALNDWESEVIVANNTTFIWERSKYDYKKINDRFPFPFFIELEMEKKKSSIFDVFAYPFSIFF